MKPLSLIKNASVINEGEIKVLDVLIEGAFIKEIGKISAPKNCLIIEGEGKFLLPGIIDGQVHFREPGFTHKGTIHTESRAGIAGGVTSYIDMPNTIPNVLTLEALAEKYRLAALNSLSNYSFFLGINDSNVRDLISWDTSGIIGISDDGLYMSNKGNLLAENPETMELLFKNCQNIIAIHSEIEAEILKNEALFEQRYGRDIPAKYHPKIRSWEACYKATKRAIEIAKKHQARLHILHLSTLEETHLFDANTPLTQKRITTEVSVHHLYFSEVDYESLGMRIKWNPAIKTKKDQEGLLRALIDNRIDLITTDHAPHTLEEKERPYFESMSGAPMVQHSLNCMIDFFQNGKISLEKIIEKMCHNPAILYGIKQRGFIKEGYYADLVLVDLDTSWTVHKDNILYKCGWSPLEGRTFKNKILKTFVNGNLVYDNGQFYESKMGMPLQTSQQKDLHKN